MFYHGSCPRDNNYGTARRVYDCTRGGVNVNSLPHCSRVTQAIPWDQCYPPMAVTVPTDISLISYVNVAMTYSGITPMSESDVSPLTCPTPVDTNNPNITPSNKSIIFTSAPYTLMDQCKVDDICNSDQDLNTFSGSLVKSNTYPNTGRIRLRSVNSGEETGGLGFRLWTEASVGNPTSMPLPSYRMTYSFPKGAIRIVLPHETIPANSEESFPSVHPKPGASYTDQTVVQATLVQGTRDVSVYVNAMSEFCRQFTSCLECHRHAQNVGCYWHFEAEEYGLAPFCTLGITTPTPTAVTLNILDCKCSQLATVAGCLAQGCQYCMHPVIASRCVPITPVGRHYIPGTVGELCHATFRNYAIPGPDGLLITEPINTDLSAAFRDFVAAAAQLFDPRLLDNVDVQPIKSQPNAHLISALYTFSEASWLATCRAGCFSPVGGLWSLESPLVMRPPATVVGMSIDDAINLSHFNMSAPDRYFGHHFILRDHAFLLLRRYIFTVFITFGVQERYPSGVIFNHHGPNIRSAKGGEAWSHYALEWGMLKTPDCTSNTNSRHIPDYGKLRLIRHHFVNHGSDPLSESKVLWEEPVQFPLGTQVLLTIAVHEDDHGVQIAVFSDNSFSRAGFPMQIDQTHSQKHRFTALDSSPRRIIGGTVGLLSLGGIQSEFTRARIYIPRRALPALVISGNSQSQTSNISPGTYQLSLSTSTSPLPLLISFMLYTSSALPPRDNHGVRFGGRIVSSDESICEMFVTATPVNSLPTTITFSSARPFELANNMLFIDPGTPIAVGFQGAKCLRYFLTLEDSSPNADSSHIPYTTSDSHLWACRKYDPATEPQLSTTLENIATVAMHSRRFISGQPCPTCFTPMSPNLDHIESGYSRTRLYGIDIPQENGNAVPTVCITTTPSFGSGFKLTVGSVTQNTVSFDDATQLYPSFRGGVSQLAMPQDLSAAGPPPIPQSPFAQIVTSVNYPAVYLDSDTLAPFAGLDIFSVETRIDDMYIYPNVQTRLGVRAIYRTDIRQIDYYSSPNTPVAGFTPGGVVIFNVSCPVNELSFTRTLAFALPRFVENLNLITFVTGELNFGLHSGSSNLTPKRRFCQRPTATAVSCQFSHSEAFMNNALDAYIAIYLQPSHKDTSQLHSSLGSPLNILYTITNNDPLPINYNWPKTFSRHAYLNNATVELLNVKQVFTIYPPLVFALSTPHFAISLLFSIEVTLGYYNGLIPLSCLITPLSRLSWSIFPCLLFFQLNLML